MIIPFEIFVKFQTGIKGHHRYRTITWLIRHPERFRAFMTSLIRFIFPDTMKDLANFSRDEGDISSALSCSI